MVAIPVLIRPGLDEGHKESSENDEEKKREKRLDMEETHISNSSWRGRLKQKGENW